jgi:enamine deaminase RidA (YjgF/YER057c/UK114 family)
MKTTNQFGTGLLVVLIVFLTSCGGGSVDGVEGADAGGSVGGVDFEYVHLAGTEPASGANMPFTSAIRVRQGNMVFLSGITSAPVPHSHPHVPAEFDGLDFSAAAQAESIMKRLKRTMETAGGELQDIIQVTRFVVDIGENQDEINRVMNSYWGEDHRPASTSVEIVRLATDPRFLLEVEAVAVIPEQ